MNERSRIRRSPLPLLLIGLLPLAVQAADPATGEIQKEISAELADARKEVRAELAAARIELKTGNLEVGNGMRFGKSGKRSAERESLPKAEITPRGDFLIEGKAVAIDPAQRQELLAYRSQVIDIALAGIDIGERSAQVALEAVDRGLFSLMLGAMTGSLERNLERTLKASIEPGVRQLCHSLPPLLESQQRLSASVPQFRPYATLEKDDVEDCENEIRREFAQELKDPDMRKLHTLTLVALLPLAACGKSEPTPAPVDGASQASAAQANTALGRKIQQAMAEASAKLATENIQVGEPAGNLPKAQISPQGDLLIGGKPVPVDDAQRKLLLAHRANLVAVAQAGIAIGMQGADLGIEAATGALKSVFSGEGEEFGKKMEARGQQMELEAQKICKTLPPLLDSQQALAAALPAFKPYATMDATDIDDCHVGAKAEHKASYDAGKDVGQAIAQAIHGDGDAPDGVTMDAAAEADAAAKGSSKARPDQQ